MRHPIRDAVVLITGASAGIGAEAARAFGRAGARVVLCARDAARLEATVATLRAERLTAHGVPADVTLDRDVDALVEATLARHGRIDILVANAGVGLWGPIASIAPADHRRVFEVNYFGVVRCVQAVLPAMKDRESGLIQIVSSVLAWRGAPGYGAYCATKFALRGMAEALRVELAGRGIRVQTIYPSLTDTRFSENAIRRDPSGRPFLVRPMTAGAVARRMVRCARRGTRDSIVSMGGRALAAINGVAPRLVDRILVRFMPPARSGDPHPAPEEPGRGSADDPRALPDRRQ